MEPNPRPVRYYLDSHIAKAVMIQLKRRGLDVIHCDDVGRSEAKDFEHLEFATQEGRVMVSQDRDFNWLDKIWRRENRVHAGIMLLPTGLLGGALIRYAIRELTFYDEMVAGGAATIEDDIYNQLLWL